MRHAHQTLRRLQYPGWTDAQLAALRVSTVVIVVWYPPAAEAAVPAKGGVRGLEDMTGFHVRSVAEVPRRSAAAAQCGKRLGRGGGGGVPLAGTDSTVGKSAAAGGGRLGPPFRRILGTGMAGGAAVRPGRSADGVLRSPQLGKPRGTVPSPSITHTADGGPRQCAVGSAAPGEHRP